MSLLWTKKYIAMGTIYGYGFSCPCCSDGISYPERVMALVLKALGINFKKQHKFNDYGEYYYDFYLIDYGIIIEVHGEQHYEKFHRHSNWKSYEDEHENDLVKYDIAVLNEYEYNKDYFIIDTKKSNINYIRQSIESCIFFKQFNLDDINWQNIDIKAQISLKIEVCKYWNEQKQVNKDLTTIDVAKVFDFTCYATVVKYLTWGNENGFCTYSGEEERKARIERQSKFIYLIKPDGTKWYEEAMSQRELARLTGISGRTIGRLIEKNIPLKSHGNAQYDSKYIGSYIVDADEWDSKQNKLNELN